MNRFAFLKTDYENLYKLCTEAEDHHNMNKARQVIEIIVRQFGAVKRHLFDRIGEVSEKAGMPKDIIDAFHQVRLVGNKASHDETLTWNKITDDDVDKCLNALFEIVVWLAVSYDKRIYSPNEFNPEDLPIVDKYLDEDVKAKRDKIKKMGTFINSLDISCDDLDFDNAADDELLQDVFETESEYINRINKLPLQHIGYAILDNRTRDNYTGLTFAMFHIEKNDKIIFANINALVSSTSSVDCDFIDGKILVGLKVHKGKIYCDYDRVYLQSQEGDEIQLTAICWIKYGYEDEKTFNQRLTSLPVLPLGVAKPIRKEYDLDSHRLPFKVALYRYVQTVLNVGKIIIIADKDRAKAFCGYEEYFRLYGNINRLLETAILKHSQFDDTIRIKEYLKDDIQRSD